MARGRKFLDIDVVTAAYQRMRRVFETFDTVVVCFSGGKDSQVVKTIAEDVGREFGALPIQVLFRDEELIPDAVIDFVKVHRERPTNELRWFALRMHGTKFILGRTLSYVQWDPTRRWIRQPPPFAITLPPGDDRTFTSNHTDAFAVTFYPGKVVFLTGVRAAESLTRYRSCVNKLGEESWVVDSKVPRLKLAKPIYDWQEMDVLKFLHDRGEPMCPLYLAQHFAGDRLRVSTPLHSEAAKRIGVLRKTAPVFYDQLLSIFPEMIPQERYWNELDREVLRERYGTSYEGCRVFVDEMDDETRRTIAARMLESALARAERDPTGYPPIYVFSWLESGAYYKECMAIEPDGRESWAKKQRALDERVARRALPAVAEEGDGRG